MGLWGPPSSLGPCMSVPVHPWARERFGALGADWGISVDFELDLYILSRPETSVAAILVRFGDFPLGFIGRLGPQGG